MIFKFRKVVALAIVTTFLTLSQETYGNADVYDNHMEEQPQQADDGSANIEPDGQEPIEQPGDEVAENAPPGDEQLEDAPPDENQQGGETHELAEAMEIIQLNAKQVDPEQDQEGDQEVDLDVDPEEDQVEDQEVDQEVDLDVDPEEDQVEDQEVDQEVDLDVDPEEDQVEDQEVDQEGDQEVGQEIDQELLGHKTGDYDLPNGEDDAQLLAGPMKDSENEHKKDCWLTLNGIGIFKALTDLESKYSGVRRDYENAVGAKMDKQMLDTLLGTKGAAFRAIRNYGGNLREIPAGINLGGYSMMRQKDSLLFFHRMKLRNSTVFQVNYLHNDLVNMALLAHLSLNDLHLLGAYERTPTHTDPSVLFFRPTYGSLELLLKNVTYHMEARMRMMFDRITIEVINSELLTNDILMTFYNANITAEPDSTQHIEARNIEDFLERLKTDLDLWLKDYFNDYLMFYILPDHDNTQFQESEKKKALYLNEYANYAVNAIRQRVYDVGGSEVKLPKFTLFSVPDMVVRLTDGVLRGLDSMHQRSVATAMRREKFLQIDLVLTFARLKVEYTFEAILPDGSPPLTGSMVLTAEDVATHMGITLIENQDITDLNFDFIQHMKPEYLVIEGPVNRLIANYQHLLENEILSLMTNVLMHNIKMLNSLPRCKPFLHSNTIIEEEEFRRRSRQKRKLAKALRQHAIKSPKHVTKSYRKH